MLDFDRSPPSCRHEECGNPVRGESKMPVGTTRHIAGAVVFAAGALAITILLMAGRADAVDVRIESRVAGGPWSETPAVYPLKGQKVTLRVEFISGAEIRWFRIVPDLTRNYKNAQYPWDPQPYKWIGFARIAYERRELEEFRGHWEIEPFARGGRVAGPGGGSPYARDDAGSFWFQAEVDVGGMTLRSPGFEDRDGYGVAPRVMRVSIRDGGGFLGFLASFFNVPGLFGSVPRQSESYVGVDCADVIAAARARWKGDRLVKDFNVAQLVATLPRVREFEVSGGNPGSELRWGDDVRPGDVIAVRYRGARQYQHIGALFADANRNGRLDAEDEVIHAGPAPLQVSHLGQGGFDGHVVLLRMM